MKKIILVATLLVVGFINAQVSTTEEEYNYLTKGLKIAEESGLDIKKGYELVPLISDEFHNFKIDYFEFKNIAESKTKAILIKLIKVKEGTDKTAYLCMPFNNKELWKKFRMQANPSTLSPIGLGSGQIEALTASINKALPIYIDKIKNN